MKYLKFLIILLSAISYGILCYFLNDLYLLKNTLVLVGVAVLLVVILLMSFGLLKLKSKIFKFILTLLLIIIIGVNSVGTYYLAVTDNFISKFDEKVIEYDYYYLLSLKSSNIKTVDDLNNKVIGVTENNQEKVIDFIDVSVESKVNSNITNLISEFYLENYNAVLISEIEKFVWQEYDEKFFENIDVIATFKEEKKENTNSNANEVVEINFDKPFAVYISGIDNAGSISSIGRSDVNIVMTVNPETSQVLLTSIPRDYYVQLHGTTGVRDKLTHAGVYGIDMSVTTIEDLLGIDIINYIKVNFNTVTDLINLVGGIDIYSDIALNHCNVVAGNNHLNGKNALCFARERKSYAAGDRQRGVNQEIVIEALIKKVSTSKELLLKYNDVLNSLSNNLYTNVSSEFIKQMVGYQLDKMPNWQVKFLNLDGYGSSNITYSCGDMMLYVMEPNYDTVNNAKAAINDVLNGKLFSEMNYPFTK